MAERARPRERTQLSQSASVLVPFWFWIPPEMSPGRLPDLETSSISSLRRRWRRRHHNTSQVTSSATTMMGTPTIANQTPLPSILGPCSSPLEHRSAFESGLEPGTQEASAMPVAHLSCGGAGVREVASADAHEICHALWTRTSSPSDEVLGNW